jgi:hypothetical protein
LFQIIAQFCFLSPLPIETALAGADVFAGDINRETLKVKATLLTSDAASRPRITESSNTAL